ncbi:LIM and senescent cell antigen-like-containing domain protein 2 [Varanus komodoensis]|nr:LIM and senescent cell antigen-like-containing domain protein 2 [Varanus komodoensis]
MLSAFLLGTVAAVSSALGHLCRTCHNREKAKGLGKYICQKCHLIIDEQPLMFRNDSYHPDHFNCTHCGKELTADARELKGELYCLPCHDKMGIPICGACRRPIEGRVVNALGKQWHVEHFVCAKCEKPFLGHRHYEKKGLAYCETHYNQEQNVNKARLPVMWWANARAWVTRKLFMEWLHEVFAPTVQKYVSDSQLPERCLLLMDNAPAHPPALVDDMDAEYDFIKVKFLPHNTTALLQPMNQQVICNFKKLYTKALFSRCFNVTEETSLTLKEFWKKHFNVLHCINLIDKAWEDVTYWTLNSAWKTLWPECITECDSEGSDAEAVEEIASLGKSMGLDLSGADIEKLVEDHKEELMTEELAELQSELQKALAEEDSTEEEEDREEKLLLYSFFSTQLFGDVCYNCSHVIEGDVVSALNKAWCVNCFSCSTCNIKLTLKNKFVEFDMKPVCKKCYEKFPLELKKRLKKLSELASKKTHPKALDLNSA